MEDLKGEATPYQALSDSQEPTRQTAAAHAKALRYDRAEPARALIWVEPEGEDKSPGR